MAQPWSATSRSVPVLGPVSGRGARSNRSGRYEPTTREDFDDGWNEEDGAPARIDDTLTPLKSASVITRNTSPDIGFDRSINPYVGCSHGCIYCYARPSHARMGLSPGVDFESKLFYKPDAAAVLERELSAPGYSPATVHIGGNTDPYQPVERTARSTRAILEVLSRYGHPASIITKSALIRRDLDILAPMAARGLLRAAVSVTTLDRALARDMEPRAATPERRIETIGALAAAGVPVAALFAPVIPGLNDHELEAVLGRCADAGATSASYVVLRLPDEIAGLFKEWLEDARPDRAARVMSLVRQMRGGREYVSEWGERMKGRGPVADLVRVRFAAAMRRYGLDGPRAPLRCDLFAPPPRAGDQLALL